MTWTLTCDCEGRFIKHDRGSHTCSKCGSHAYINSTPRAVQYRQVEYDYECPVTGIPIQSKAAHEYNLELHGKHVLEKGELEDAKRVRQAQDEAFEDMICETAAQYVHDLPDTAKAVLEQELLTSDVSLSRGSLK